MGDRFAGVPAIVDDQPEPAVEGEFFGELRCDQKKVSEERPVVRRSIFYPWNRFFRNNQQVQRCFGVDVVNGDAMIILVFDSGGHLAVDDFTEESFFAHAIDFAATEFDVQAWEMLGFSSWVGCGKSTIMNDL